MNIIFRSPAMHDLLARARRFAQTSATILIAGESGTGKELLAQYIHRHAVTTEGAFVTFNCANLNESLAESELFGHEQGAFTGAVRERQGVFETAGAGTLLLDEIGEIPLPLQAKLLRVLETLEYRRVGSCDKRYTQARVLAATNRDLRQEVQAGHFRNDLFHRLDVLSLTIPPLRERPQDIPPLVAHFLAAFAQERGIPVREVSPLVLRQLTDYSWPGNVRELRNVLYRSSLQTDTAVLEQVDLPAAPPAEGLDPCGGELQQSSLREIERQVILDRLKTFDGNKSRASQSLGVTPRTLCNKLTHYRRLGYAS